MRSVAMSTSASPQVTGQRYLVIGDSAVARRVGSILRSQGEAVSAMAAPSDAELASAVSQGVASVAVLLDEDVAALRYALAIAHLNPVVPIVATIFDRTVGAELRRLVPAVVVTSAADVGASLLAGPCLGEDVATVRRIDDDWIGLGVDHELNELPIPLDATATRTRVARRLAPSPWALVESGERMLILGAGGLLGALALEMAWARSVHGWSWAHAFYNASNVIATVGPAHGGSGWTYWLPAGLAIIATLGFAAMFVAGLVDRLAQRSARSAFGKRSVPRADHVIVVGLGQVGLRLCRDLQSMGVPVVGVERDDHAGNLRFARTEHIPVVVGHGEDRRILESLNLDTARAIAAVSSDDLDNVAVAVAAHAVNEGLTVVLRAGEQEAVAETRSILPLGVTRDVITATAAHICAEMRGLDRWTVIQVGDRVGTWDGEGRLTSWMPGRDID
jgi:hypothetical protein